MSLTESTLAGDLVTKAYLCYTVFMRTTFELPDHLFRQAKAAAALQGISMKELFTRAIAEKLKKSPPSEQEKPWMQFYGKGREYNHEFEKLEILVAEEFESIRDEDWK